jgi:hypothetical protein
MLAQKIKKIFFSLTWLVALSIVVFCVAPTEGHALEIMIDIAPNVLNIQSTGVVVTVHTDIGFGDVNAPTVCLNGVTISSWKADNRGNFVAKFSMVDVKALPLTIDAYNTFTMEGETTSGEKFSGTQDILVINREPRSGI